MRLKLKDDMVLFIPVDSGIISIISNKELKKHKAKISDKYSTLYHIASIDEGYYNINIDNEYFKRVRIEKGEYFIGDPCYVFDSENWVKVLKKTNYFKNIDAKFLKNVDDGLHKITIEKI